MERNLNGGKMVKKQKLTINRIIIIAVVVGLMLFLLTGGAFATRQIIDKATGSILGKEKLPLYECSATIDAGGITSTVPKFDGLNCGQIGTCYDKGLYRDVFGFSLIDSIKANYVLTVQTDNKEEVISKGSVTRFLDSDTATFEVCSDTLMTFRLYENNAETDKEQVAV